MKYLLLLLLLLPALAKASVSVDEDNVDEAEPGEMSVEEISRKLENPLSTLWSLTLQENYTVLEGDAQDSSEWKNT